MAVAEQIWFEPLRLLIKALATNDLGRPEEARQVLGEIIARHAHSGAFQIAEAYAWFGSATAPSSGWSAPTRGTARRTSGFSRAIRSCEAGTVTRALRRCSRR